MYPNTQFEIQDDSKLILSVDEDPIYCTELLVSSTDKGPEDLRFVSGDKFYKLYGRNNTFAKHGQPIIQAANVLSNHGGLLFKRLVAPDATLANIGIFANVVKVKTQKKDEDGNLLYQDSIGNETTASDPGNEPVMITSCKITYSCESVIGAKSIEDCTKTFDAKLIDSIDDDVSETISCVYPLIVIADNGRGLSKKKFRISPNYTRSRNKDVMFYSFDVIENNTILETVPFTLNHNYIDISVNKNMALSTSLSNSDQVNVHLFEKNFDMFIAKVAQYSDIDSEDAYALDLFFGRSKEDQNFVIEDIDVDLKRGFNLSYIYGIDLPEGSNGSFGETPWGTEAYQEQAIELFDGTFTNKIFDLYNAQFEVMIDANYPVPVKTAIERLAVFREDFMFMRDSGLGLSTVDEITVANEDITKSKFIMPYALSYDIEDPSSLKDVNVTVGYSLARLMINHIRNGANRPVAGQSYKMTIPEAKENTVNFIPSITPSVNECKEMSDCKINYASYYNGVLVLETFFTSQDDDTELSYGSNMFALQSLMRDIRNQVPKSRYAFTDGDDFTSYKEDVDAIITKHASDFDYCVMEYVADDAQIMQKVFYAVIKVKFKNFIFAEKFKIIALPVNYDTSKAANTQAASAV